MTDGGLGKKVAPLSGPPHAPEALAPSATSTPIVPHKANRNRAIIVALLGLVLVLGSGYVPEASLFYPIAKLGHEIGFALIVAITAWLTFEYFARSETEEMWRARISEITENVFYAVHRRRLAPEYIAMANELILTPKFLRREWRIEVDLSDGVYVKKGRQTPCVLLSTTNFYKIENVTETTQTFALKIMIQNTFDPDLNALIGVPMVSVSRGLQKFCLDLTKQREKLKADLATNLQFVTFHMGDFALGPKDHLSVSNTLTVPKSGHDSELYLGLYPADQLDVVIMNHGPTNRDFGVSSIHQDEFELVQEAVGVRRKHLRISRYFLPSQGVMVWWKS